VILHRKLEFGSYFCRTPFFSITVFKGFPFLRRKAGSLRKRRTVQPWAWQKQHGETPASRHTSCDVVLGNGRGGQHIVQPVPTCCSLGKRWGGAGVGGRAHTAPAFTFLHCWCCPNDTFLLYYTPC
jgi:hypothetical protein